MTYYINDKGQLIYHVGWSAFAVEGLKTAHGEILPLITITGTQGK